MTQAQESDDYVLATGEMQTIRQLHDDTFEYIKLDWSKYEAIDPRYLRPTEVNLLLGDCAKAKEKLGWAPKTNCKKLAELMVDHALELAQHEATQKSFA